MLVGHSDAVLTVAVSVTNKSHVISGSKDCNLILWDLHNGEEIHTLAGHLGPVTCVKVSADGEKQWNKEIIFMSVYCFCCYYFFFVSIKAFSLLFVTRKVHSTFNRNDIIYRKNNLLTQTYINVKRGYGKNIFIALWLEISIEYFID